MPYYLITVSEWGGIQELDEAKLKEFADKGYLDHLVSLDDREKIHDTFTLYDDDHLLIRGELVTRFDGAECIYREFADHVGDAPLTVEEKRHLLNLALEASEANEETERTADQAFETLLAAFQDIPRQLQIMLDAIVAAQEFMPMPKENWEQFVRDIEYTNRKHGLNLKMPHLEIVAPEIDGSDDLVDADVVIDYGPPKRIRIGSKIKIYCDGWLYKGHWVDEVQPVVIPANDVFPEMVIALCQECREARERAIAASGALEAAALEDGKPTHEDL